MEVVDLINESSIKLNLKATSKEEIIDELCRLHLENGNINDLEGFKSDILKREENGTTGLEKGVALPHAKSEYAVKSSIVLGVVPDGVDFGSMDKKPSTIIFMMSAPEEALSSHLKALSKLTLYLIDEDFRKKVLQAKTPKEIMEIMSSKKEEQKKVEKKIHKKEVKILAVTACPAGIAHTYMAANALEKKATELGESIKVETNGSTGVKNLITKEDIENASGIIVAVDKAVEMDRFEGKHVLIVPVKAGMERPEELIKKAPDAPIYRCSGPSSKNSVQQRSGFYRHLMNGVSNMLPFVVGGGILIAISFMFGIKAFDPNDPNFNKIAKFLMELGGDGAFALMIPILAGFIGKSIADRPGFMPAMVAGMMASTNGGGFLGGLIGGFIGGYSVLLIKKLTAKLPEILDGLKPVLIFPVLGLILTGIAMNIILGPITFVNNSMVGFLNSLNSENLVLLGIILGGMMAIDMGGPINKAAFTFGIAAISAGNYYPHAAVMAGGMVPPLGIALATTIFKNKFTLEEKHSGKTNYILGASFITEGAIPFAASDPIRVIPACIIGSALAGGLAMLFGTKLPAPHGGLFVLPIITHPFLYLLAVLIGSLITGLIVGISKKEIKEVK